MATRRDPVSKAKEETDQMKPFSVLLTNEILMIFERKKNLCSLSPVCSQHITTCSLLLLNQPVWGAQGLLGSSCLSVFFSVEFEVLPTPSGSSLSLTGCFSLGERKKMLLFTFVNACPWFSVLCFSGCPWSSLSPLVWAHIFQQFLGCLSGTTSWTQCFVELTWFFCFVCLFLFSTFYDEVTTCELLGLCSSLISYSSFSAIQLFVEC